MEYNDYCCKLKCLGISRGFFLKLKCVWGSSMVSRPLLPWISVAAVSLAKIYLLHFIVDMRDSELSYMRVLSEWSLTTVCRLNSQWQFQHLNRARSLWQYSVTIDRNMNRSRMLCCIEWWAGNTIPWTARFKAWMRSFQAILSCTDFQIKQYWSFRSIWLLQVQPTSEKIWPPGYDSRSLIGNVSVGMIECPHRVSEGWFPFIILVTDLNSNILISLYSSSSFKVSRPSKEDKNHWVP